MLLPQGWCVWVGCLVWADYVTRRDLQGTAQEVTAQDWPLARPLLVYVRRLPGQAADPLARDYLRFLLSPQGQALVAARSGGYLPLTPEQAQAELRKLDEAAPTAPKGD